MASPNTSTSTKLRRTLQFLASLIVPAGLAVFLSQYLIPNSSFQASWALPLMIGWGALGAGIHYLSLKRGNGFRVGMTLLLAGLTVGLCFGLWKAFAIDYSQLKTCPVCGFSTLKMPGDSCAVCQIAFKPEHASQEGYSDAQEYLQAEQIIYFMPVPPDTSIDFFRPCNCQPAYPKDPTWKPSTTAQDIREVAGMVK